ncbi:hypothetical protein C8R44DRAFT_892299 [Mycena epipterygia]|nr:hypothetical protein C8R44DRAFT_892299 [Mycena epipterygia]
MRPVRTPFCPIPPNPARRAPLRTPLRTLPASLLISTPTCRTSPPPPNPVPTLLAFAPPLRCTAHPIPTRRAPHCAPQCTPLRPPQIPAVASATNLMWHGCVDQ